VLADWLACPLSSLRSASCERRGAMVITLLVQGQLEGEDCKGEEEMQGKQGWKKWRI